MKILVTGANGYIGQGIIKYLLDKNHEVIATSRHSVNIDKRAIIKEIDLFDLDNMDTYSFFDKPDIVLHLAWRNGFVHNSITHLEDLPFHYKFLENLITNGAKHVAVMGTMHEVGFFEGSIKEDTPCNPMSLYGISKNALRDATKQFCKTHSVIWQWLRGYYIVGNSEHGCSIFSKITLAEKNGEKLFPFTQGLNQWDFLDYDKFCEYTAKAITQNKINGIINICSGMPQRLCERVERFIRENNYKIKLDYGKFPDRPYDSKAVWGDDYKIQQILSFTK